MLDELDQLESKGQDVLYTLFEWPQLPSSRLVLVGEYAGCSTAALEYPPSFRGVDGDFSLQPPPAPSLENSPHPPLPLTLQGWRMPWT